MGNIYIGQYVRSFDFPRYNRDVEGENACYVEGVVSDVVEKDGGVRYQIEVDRKVWEGEEVKIQVRTVFPPINGTPTLFGRFTCGVEPLSKAIIHKLNHGCEN